MDEDIKISIGFKQVSLDELKGIVIDSVQFGLYEHEDGTKSDMVVVKDRLSDINYFIGYIDSDTGANGNITTKSDYDKCIGEEVMFCTLRYHDRSNRTEFSLETKSGRLLILFMGNDVIVSKVKSDIE